MQPLATLECSTGSFVIKILLPARALSKQTLENPESMG